MRTIPFAILAALLLAAASPAEEPKPAAPAPSPPTPVPAARVHRLDGRTVAGRDLKPRGAKIEVATSDNSAEAVDLADVLEARIDPLVGSGTGLRVVPTVEVEFVNRDLLRGALQRGLGETGFTVRSDALGEVEVALDAVAAVRFLAAYAKAEDPPPLEASEKGDRFVFATGDRIEGTLRSVTPQEIRVRAAGGVDRVLRTDSLLGFALLPLRREPEAGLRVTLVLVDGSRVSGTAVEAVEKGWSLRGMLDGKERTIPAWAVEGLSVRGGRGTPLPDLKPASVEVRPYWGDDPPALRLEPRMDRAFTLDRGPPPPIRLGGRAYYRGVSSFSGTALRYDLEGKGFRTFVASVGVDDAGPKGAVEFEVLLDGKSAWKSGVVRPLPPGGEPLAMPPLDVSRAKSLDLVVHAGPGDDVQDFADWVKAALLP